MTPFADASDPPHRVPWRPLAGLTLALGLSVGAFLDRPIHIDETVFVTIARHIAQNPADFYGLEINWTGSPRPVHEFMMNPPLSSYALALAGRVLGWGEAALHVAFAPVALAALIGTYLLARRFTRHPGVAALAVLWTPGFLVSSTLVLSDVMALALWVFSLVAWERGLRASSTGWLLGGALLAGLAGLTEYFASALILLLALHAYLSTRRVGVWLAALALPLALWAGYEGTVRAVYGHGGFAAAADYAGRYQGDTAAHLARSLALGLAFTGGCVASALFLSLALLSRRGWLLWAAAAGFATAVPLLAPGLAVFGWDGWILAQLGFWSVVGCGVLALGVDELRRRGPGSPLLLAWLAGTFVFASFVNWTINARSVLPLIPAVGILIARRLDRRAADGTPAALIATGLGLALAAALSVATLWADVRLAETTRAAARSLAGGSDAGETVWFQGHWGFQYYAESLGAQPLDRRRSQLQPGDRVIVPANNSYRFPLPRRKLGPPQRHELPVPRWLSTMNPAAGAGFHAATFGPLPFAFGGATPEVYWVYESLGAVDVGEWTRTRRGAPARRPRR